MDISTLLKGLEFFNKEFSSPRWNISSDAETVIVWDDDQDDCSIVSDNRVLDKLGWGYDGEDNGWRIKPPIYVSMSK